MLKLSDLIGMLAIKSTYSELVIDDTCRPFSIIICQRQAAVAALVCPTSLRGALES